MRWSKALLLTAIMATMAGGQVGIGIFPHISKAWQKVLSKSTPAYDVKAYGAVGDGETDDATAIQAAFDACPQGGTILFPPGIYRVNSTITLGDWTIDEANNVDSALSGTRSGITIRGSGNFKYRSTYPRIVWGGAAQAGTTHDTITDESGTYDLITDMDPVMQVFSCRGLTIENLTIDGNDLAYDGLLIDGYSSHGRITNCLFTNCVHAGLRAGIWYDTEASAYYYGYVDAPSYATKAAIKAAGGFALFCSYAVSGCRFYSSAIGASIESQQALGSSFIGCAFGSNSLYDVLKYGSSFGVYNCNFNSGTPTCNVYALGGGGGRLLFHGVHSESTPSSGFFGSGTTDSTGPYLSFDTSDIVGDVVFGNGAGHIEVRNTVMTTGQIIRSKDANRDFYVYLSNSTLEDVNLPTSSYDSRIQIAGSNINVSNTTLLQGVGAAENVRSLWNVYPTSAYALANNSPPLAVSNGATSSGYADFYEDSDNGTNKLRLTGIDNLPADITISALQTQVYNVRAYGATGNGTTDDTTAIQAAFTAAHAAAAPLYLPAGNYLVTTTLGTVTIEGMHIYGAGTDLTKITHSGSDASPIWLLKGDHFNLHDFSIYDNDQTLVGIQVGVASPADSASRGTIARVLLENCAKGIYNAYGWINTIMDCRTHLGGYGLDLNVANAMQIFRFESQGDVTGIYIVSGSSIALYTPTIEGCTSYGLRVAGGGVACYSPYFEDNEGYQIYVDGGAGYSVREFNLYGGIISDSDDSHGDVHLDQITQLIYRPGYVTANIPPKTTITNIATAEEFPVGISVSNAATSAGFMDLKEDSDNGTDRVRYTAPAALPTNGVSVLYTLVWTLDVDDDASTDDYQFDDDAENQTEQVITLTDAIPAYGELVSCQLRCIETVTSSTAMSIDIGTSSGGDEILAAANTDAANDINTTPAAGSPELAATNAARSVYINATPGANWNTLDAGRWAIMLTILDYATVYAND